LGLYGYIGQNENEQNGIYDEYIDWIGIGRHRYKNDDKSFFNGKIDEVRIWNYPKNQNQIVDNMFTIHSGVETGLVALWNFAEDNGTDLSGNGFNGISQDDAFAEVDNLLKSNFNNRPIFGR
jgi:hypothetical protein